MVSEIDGPIIRGLVAARRRVVGNATVRRDLTAVSRVLAYAQSFGLREGNPALDAICPLREMGGVADLGDPPTLTLTLPGNAGVTTASGVFHNFVSATVPEPSTWAMMLLGFAGLGFAGYRTSRRTAAFTPPAA
jgi:hypothetical protein